MGEEGSGGSLSAGAGRIDRDDGSRSHTFLRSRVDMNFEWRGRRVQWTSFGEGEPVVFCHGTPWSSAVWRPLAEALANEYRVYLWDMPGYGQSSKDADHRVSLDVQGELFADLLTEWGLEAPHVIAHDYGGAVSLRAHLLHGARFASLALVDVVALAPWGSDFFRLVHNNEDVFAALPPSVHEGAVRAYISGASHAGLTDDQMEVLIAPWRGPDGQAALYRQMAQADQAYTDEIESRYGELDLPVVVAWGADDAWVPVDRAHRLASTIPGARLELVEGAGHLIQFDAPEALATRILGWLRDQSSAAAR